MECGRMPYIQRLPCVKGAVAKRLRDCAVQPLDENNGLAKRYAKTTFWQNLPDLTAPRQNRSSSDSVRSDDGHTGSPPLQPLSQLRCQLPLHRGALDAYRIDTAFLSTNSSPNSNFPLAWIRSPCLYFEIRSLYSSFSFPPHSRTARWARTSMVSRNPAPTG